MTTSSDAERDKKLKVEAIELAKLPYKWRQTLPDLDVTIALPKGTRGKDLVVKIQKQKVSFKELMQSCLLVSRDKNQLLMGIYTRKLRLKNRLG